MKRYLREMIVAGLFFAVFGYICANSGTGSIVVEETTDNSEIYGECEELLVAELEDNYEDAFIQMSEFFKSTNTAFAKINERLDRIESDNAMIKIYTANTTNPEAFLKSLPPPENGHFFRGSTFERIATALPNLSLAVKFVNYMDTDLTGYQLGDSWGSVNADAPTNVPSQTAQMATFKSDSDGDVRGTMMYSIEGTNSFLHVFFLVWSSENVRTFAVAFLSKNTPDLTIGWDSCTDPGRPNEPIEKYRCETDVTFDTTKSLLVHEGIVYAKVTFTPKQTTSTLIIEVFKTIH